MQHKITTCWQQLVDSELLSDEEILQTCMKPGSDVIDIVCSSYAELCGADQQLPGSYLHQDKLATALYMAMPLVSEPLRGKVFFVLCSLVSAPPEMEPLNEMRMTSPYHPTPLPSTASASATAKDPLKNSTTLSARNDEHDMNHADGSNSSSSAEVSASRAGGNLARNDEHDADGSNASSSAKVSASRAGGNLARNDEHDADGSNASSSAKVSASIAGGNLARNDEHDADGSNTSSSAKVSASRAGGNLARNDEHDADGSNTSSSDEVSASRADSAGSTASQLEWNGESPYLEDSAGNTASPLERNGENPCLDSAGNTALPLERNGENPFLGRTAVQISVALAEQLGEEIRNVEKLGAETCWEVSSVVIG
eukprot:gene4340-14454_t